MATSKNTTKRMSITSLIKLAQADPKLAEQIHQEQQASGAIKAFSKFQQALEPAPKRGVVDYWNKKKRKYVTAYNYVYFDDLKQTVNKAMKDTGLIWRQTPDNCTTTRIPVLDKYGKPTGQLSVGEVVGIKTVISYKNGYPFKTGYMRTVSSTTSPQDVGSAMTYCKRYSLATAVGISTSPDRDGKQQYPKPQARSQQPQAPRTPQAPTISNGQIAKLNNLIHKSADMTGVPAEGKNGIFNYMATTYARSYSIRDMPASNFGKAKKFLEGEIMDAVSAKHSAEKKSTANKGNGNKPKDSTKK